MLIKFNAVEKEKPSDKTSSRKISVHDDYLRTLSGGKSIAVIFLINNQTVTIEFTHKWFRPGTYPAILPTAPL
jgi:predicted transcriptional regulator